MRGVARALPVFDGFDGVDEHDDVEGEVVARPKEAADFHDEHGHDADPRLDAPRHGPAKAHHEDVA